jgi:hypothetical protein
VASNLFGSAPLPEGFSVAELTKYLKKTSSHVVAVQLDVETDGFSYRKWGGTQTCKAGDWIVNNNGDIYTVDRDTFARTYRPVSPGLYEKVAPVWAEVAKQPGQIATKEGVTHYKAGAYLVYNEADGRDGYAVEAETFEKMYEPAG